jgi:D-arabinose 1-dehydrogenase-like Zn-dependent alcohol dehydrogenase
MSSGTGFNGCYATHIVIRKGTSVIKLPDVIGDGLAATINCALATMVNCVDQVPERVKRGGKRVLIQVTKKIIFCLFVYFCI